MGNNSSRSGNLTNGAANPENDTEANPPLPTLEVGFVGQEGSGKTSFVLRLTTNRDGRLKDPPRHPSSDNGITLKSLSDIEFQLKPVDPGPSRFYEPRGSWWLNKSMVVLIYDQSRAPEELELDQHWDSFRKWGVHTGHYVMVGNKKDAARQDTVDFAVDAANRFNIPHYSVSALTNEGLYDAIAEAAIECWRRKETGEWNPRGVVKDW